MGKPISVIKFLNTLFVLQIGKTFYSKAKIKKDMPACPFLLSLKINLADAESISL